MPDDFGEFLQGVTESEARNFFSSEVWDLVVRYIKIQLGMNSRLLIIAPLDDQWGEEELKDGTKRPVIEVAGVRRLQGNIQATQAFLELPDVILDMFKAEKEAPNAS